MIGKDLLGSDFRFTQRSLGVFLSCPENFKFQYIDKLRWENDGTSEKNIILGKSFHLAVQRYFLGIENGIELSPYSDDLKIWFETLKIQLLLEDGKDYFPELKLSSGLDGYFLDAIYDLVVLSKDKIEIFDFKTGYTSNSKEKADKYLKSLQTMVYLYVMKEYAEKKLGLPAEAISMVYWQPVHPYIITKINYNNILHEEFKDKINSIIERILNYDFNRSCSFEQQKCQYCQFKSMGIYY